MDIFRFGNIWLLFLTGCWLFACNAYHTGERSVLVTERVLPSDPLRSDLVRQAAGLIGSPYRYAGRKPETGFDCSGLTCYLFGQLDIQLPAGSANQASEGILVSLEEAREGDLVFFRRPGNERIFHVALITSRTAHTLEVIHSTSRGVVRENLLESAYWEPKIAFVRDVLSARKL